MCYLFPIYAAYRNHFPTILCLALVRAHPVESSTAAHLEIEVYEENAKEWIFIF